MIKYGLGTVPYDESTSACDGVGPRIGHRRKIRLLPPCCHLIPSTMKPLVPERPPGCAPARPAQHVYTVFFHLPFLDVPRRIARERVPTIPTARAALVSRESS